MGKLNSSLYSSKDMTWETPIDLFQKLDLAYSFDVDVCALPNTAKCEKYYTPVDNGLAQEWKGTCWMNPPYGREQKQWISKASESNCTTVCLIPARPDTKVWQDIIFPNATAICFIRGRLKFGGSKDSAPFPSALVVFGEKPNDEQLECFKSLGTLIKLIP